jgi:TetR/AcrR family transcriptional regulator, tetracycline repressor protein
MSREAIVAAAMRTVAASGYEALTIRALAAELGVSPMSLYHHVRGKDDLLDEIVDRLLAPIWRPRARRENWRSWVTEVAERLRDFLVGEPAAMHVYLRHPVVSPAAVARMTETLAVLREAGLDDDAAHKAYAALQTYTVGFAALESSRRRHRVDAASSDALETQLAAFTSPEQFREGLSLLLDGIVGRWGLAPPQSPPSTSSTR